MSYTLKALHAKCGKEAREVWKALKANGVDLEPLGDDLPFCFRIDIPGKKRFSKVSVSIPSDTMGNRARDGVLKPDKYPVAIETALFGHGGNIVYISSLGYDDVMRFYPKGAFSQDSYQPCRASSQDNIEALLAHLQVLRECKDDDKDDDKES